MRKILHVLIIISFVQITLSAQDVMMQGWYWDYPKTANGHSWSDTLQNGVAELSAAGITHLWLPPLSRASFGSFSNGYDPKDLFDLGSFGGGATGFSTRNQLDDLIDTFNVYGIKAVADVVYNHRDGGTAEANGAVEGWIENFNCTKRDAGDNPYPSDRVRMILPLGGASLNGAGTYYFKVRSASTHPDFYNAPYTIYMETNTVGFQSLPAVAESEPNGGGDCGQASNTISLGIDLTATIDNTGSCGGFCGIDEFALTINSGDYNSIGDTLYIYMPNANGNYSDHYISGLWSAARAMDIQSEIIYQTYTDFSNMPSGRGGMDYLNFKPNGNPTQLSGDLDAMLFFYDYDQNVNSTRDTLTAWTKWLWEDVGIRGFRMDAVKHFGTDFVGDLFDTLHSHGILPDMIVGENFDFNAGNLTAWSNAVEATMEPAAANDLNIRVFDFALRSALKNACDLFGFDARNVFQSGLVDGAGSSAFNAVTFINNHDFRETDQPVQNDPLLCYAYILTNNQIGIPTIFYPDYFGVSIPHAPSIALGTDLKQLINIHSNYIFGSAQMDYLNRFSNPYFFDYNSGFDNTSLIYHMTGGGSGNHDVVVAINFAGDTLDVTFDISSNSTLSNSDTLIEVTGKSLNPVSIVDGNNRIRTILPPRSYGVWVSNPVSDCTISNRIYVRKGATGLNNGSDWEHAFTNLSAALSMASRCSNVTEIWVSSDTYLPNVTNNREYGFLLPEGVEIYGGFSSAGNPEFVDRDATIYPTIFSGNISSLSNSDNVYHVVTMPESLDTTILDGFTISSGNANMAMQNQGGGIHNMGKLLLKNCKITDCHADAEGAAIYVSGNGALLIVEDCETTDNSSNIESIIETSNNAVMKIINGGLIEGQ